MDGLGISGCCEVKTTSHCKQNERKKVKLEKPNKKQKKTELEKYFGSECGRNF